MRMTDFKFPVGYHGFHRKQLFNYQLNRWYSIGYAEFKDMKAAGARIHTFKDWKREMLSLAEKAVAENNLIRAAFYYRAAEFYIKSTDPEKGRLYDRFIELFYQAIKGDVVERHEVPYEDAFLPALRIPATSEKTGTILLHGGFDSFIEEFYSLMRYFSQKGYEIIGFEGPGQGRALRKYGLPLIYEWEKPVRAVFDFFNPSQSTLIGLSMGGWLCLRAAAFEPRVERVIASGHAIDYMRCMNRLLRWIHLWCYAHCREFMDRMAKLKFENRESMTSWVVDHFKFITKKEKPLDALEIYLLMNEQNIHSELVTQDVLILAGREDHFIPFKMHEMQVRALNNAGSVTARVFTEEEHAQNHCQIGNMGLALDVMSKWIADKSG
jgi:pimeloyl-ACP methyl ester carboxylesterase